jgi:hypothetical protein
MSLIPSESYSFPDHFTSTVVPGRRQKQEKAQKKPAIVALPDPEPEIVALPDSEADFFAEQENVEVIEPVKVPVAPVPVPRPPVPNPALRRANAPPPRIPDAPPVKKIPLPPTLKPKVRWNNRAPATDPAAMRNNGRNGNSNGLSEVIPPPPPAQNVIPMKPAKPARPPQMIPTPVMMKLPAAPPPAPPSTPKVLSVQKAARPVQPPAPPLKPKPAAPSAVVNRQADFFEMFEEDGYSAAARRRKQMKLRRFIACEAAVLAVLLPLVILGLTLNVSSPALRWAMNIFTIAAAVAAAIVPIMFYAFTPTLPELER